MAAPQPRPPSITFELPDESATAALARSIARLAAAGDVIALSGELGSGKTAFARAFINALPHPAGAETGGSSVEGLLVEIRDSLRRIEKRLTSG